MIPISTSLSCCYTRLRSGEPSMPLKTGQDGGVQMQAILGPAGKRAPLGVSVGAIFLHENHVTAALPLAGAPSDAGWGPFEGN